MKSLVYAWLMAVVSLGGCKDSRSPDAERAPTPTSTGDQVPEHSNNNSATPSPPDTRRVEVVDTVHGVSVPDPYRWLEDIASPEVLAWLDAQDAFARTGLHARPGREALVARFKELYYQDVTSPPYHRAGRYFYSRQHKDKEKAVVYWKEGEAGEERVLFDPNTWSADGSVSMRGHYDLSWDGKKAAYKKSENNADEATMYVRDVASGEDSTIDVIPGAKYASAAFTPDDQGFYYENLPVDRNIPVSDRPGYTEIRYHRLGTDPKDDPLVFPALHDSRVFLSTAISRDGRWLFVYLHQGWNRADIFVKDLTAKPGPVVPPMDPDERKALEEMDTIGRASAYASAYGFTPFVVGQDAIFSVQWWRGRFYVMSNYQAPNYRVFEVLPKQVGAVEQWRVIVPEREVTLESMQIIGEHLVLSYLHDAASEIEIHDLAGKLVRTVELPPLGTASGMLGNPDEDRAYFSFSSFTSPGDIFQTSIASGKTELWYHKELPVDTSKIVAEQVFYQSKDGTRVPMFIVHRTDLEKNGKNPMLLHGYGGFNVNETPGFREWIAVWLEQGGVYALPNLRGGGEYGESWHRAGMLDKKQNVFDDFIAAAEYLIAEKYTDSEHLAIYGRSNGGLLVGAAMTQRPDLYRAVICGVPLLDMVRYHLFGSGKTWIPEYGSAEDAEQFGYLHAYSPYHHVSQGTAYPSMLMLAADADDRVDPMHARKFTAAVQWANATRRADRPVLMRVERHSGHGGADMKAKTVEQMADVIAYLSWQLGG